MTVAELSSGASASNAAPLKCDAICISGNGPTLVTEDGSTLLWNEPIDADSFVQTRATLDSKFEHSLFLPRIHALKTRWPQKFESQKIFSGPEYLIHKLCGACITILPESRYEAAYWNDDALKALNLNPERVGRFVKPGFNCGSITDSSAKLFNIKPDIPVIAGGPDFIVAMIGTNTLSQGKICDCAGSSEGVNLCTDRPVFEEGLRTLPSVIPGLWNLAALMPSSGKEFVKCKNRYEQIHAHEQIHPACTGEPRDIECRDNLATRADEPHDFKISYKDYIARCFENKDSEGYKTMTRLAYSVRDGLKLLKDCALKHNLNFSDTIMITGGQAKNEQWMQLKTDITQTTFCVTEVPDSELIGDAVLCAYSLGLYDSIQKAADSIVKIAKTYNPNPSQNQNPHSFDNEDIK